MKKLSDLDLSQTRVTDAGLEYLKGHTTLRSLALYGTRVTREGERKLRQALPKCEIEGVGVGDIIGPGDSFRSNEVQQIPWTRTDNGNLGKER